MHAHLSRGTRYGFTLLELIVTIVVLGLMAALAVPALSAVIDRSKDEVLTAELEALGRGIAALAAFDGGGATDAHVEEFLAAETAATALVSTGRWDLYADADAPTEPADSDLLFATDAGYVGLATPAAHRDGRVVYAVVGTGGAVAQITSVVDADADTAVMRGADALCFYGLVGCTADADAEPLPSTGGASSTGSEPTPTAGLSDPSSLTLVGTASSSTLDGAQQVALSGSYAYVAASVPGTLTVVDVADPGSPAVAASVDVGATAEGVAVAGGYAYVTGGSANSFTIVDVGDPTRPLVTGSVTSTSLGYARGVVVEGGYAYVASHGADSLTVIDIGDPSNPTITGSVTAPSLDYAYDVDVDGGYAFVASSYADSVTVIDITDPAAPAVVSHVTGAALNGATGIDVVSGYAYVASMAADSLAVVEVSDPVAPAVVGSTTSVALDGAHTVAVVGGHAYVASFTADSLTTIDVTSPASPQIAATITDPALDGPRGLGIGGGYVYVGSFYADALAVVG